jgi:hypothetical protein
MKKNWLLIPIALCLVLAPTGIVLIVVKKFEPQAFLMLVAICGAIYCLFPLVYEKFRTSVEFRVAWKIAFTLVQYAVMPVTLFLMLVLLLDVTTSTQRMREVLDATGENPVMLAVMFLLMALSLAIALVKIKNHRSRNVTPDAPFLALVSFFAAFSISVMMHIIISLCYFRCIGEDMGNVYVFTLFTFTAYQVFSFSYIIRNRRSFNAFPILGLIAAVVSFLAGYALLFAACASDPAFQAAVIALVPFLFIRDGDGVSAWLRSFIMAGLAGLALLSFTALQVDHAEHVTSLAGALLAGWGLFIYIDAILSGKNVAAAILKCAAWLITAALLLANEIIYGSFTDRNGIASSLLLHLGLGAAAYAKAFAVRSWSVVAEDTAHVIRKPDLGFIRKPAFLAPLIAAVLLFAGFLVFADDIINISADGAGGLRIGTAATELRAFEVTAPTGTGGLGHVVRSRVTGRKGLERYTAPEITADVSEKCASAVLGARGSYIEGIHITLDRMSPKRVYFKGKRLPPVLKTPEDLVSLQEHVGAELRTGFATSNPIEEGGALYFVLKKEKGYPSLLHLEYGNRSNAPGVDRGGKLRAAHLTLGADERCGTAAAAGTPNTLFTREMVKNLAWLGNGISHVVIKDTVPVRTGPGGTTGISASFLRGMIVPTRWNYTGGEGNWMMTDSGWVPQTALAPQGGEFNRAHYGASMIPGDDDYAALSEMVKRACASGRPLSIPRDSVWRINRDRCIVFPARIVPDGEMFRLVADGMSYLGRQYSLEELSGYGNPALLTALRSGAGAPADQAAGDVPAEPGIPVRVFGKIAVIEECVSPEGPGMFHGGEPGGTGHVQFYPDRIEKN